MKKLNIILTLLVMFVFACDNKEEQNILEIIDDSNSDIVLPDDPILPQDRVDFLDSLQEQTPEIDLDSVILPNGLELKEFNDQFPDEASGGRIKAGLSGIQLRKNDIIRDMINEANRLFKKENVTSFTNIDESTPENPHRPAQPNGIAYGYGNKDYSKRKNPSGPCFEEVYGLDCSGFVKHCAGKAGVPILDGTVNQRVAKNWDTALHSNPDNSKLYMKDLGYVPANELESGDIIVWGSHDGFIARMKNDVYLFQSNGSSAHSCEGSQACIRQQQEKNRGTSRGPHPLTFKTASTGTGWFGASYKVLRITTDISGTWTLGLRCAEFDFDALTFDVEIPKENVTDVNSDIRDLTASGSGTDYDGSALTITLTGTYNKKTNVMAAEMKILDVGGNERIDTFQIELNMDDTGYFPLVKKVDNGGCNAEVRLINTTTNSGGRSAKVKTKSGSQTKVTTLLLP